MEMKIVQFAYRGKDVDDGSMDVTKFASALLALSSLYKRSNRILNGNKVIASVRVRSELQHSSFEFFLGFGQSIPDQIKDFFLGEGVTQVKEILEFLGLIGGFSYSLIKLIKRLKGNKPDGFKKLKDGNTQVQIKNSYIEIKPEVAKLYEDPLIPKYLKKALRPIKEDKIEGLEIRKDNQLIESVNKNEVKYFTILEHIDRTTETVCEIVKVPFRSKLKWSLATIDGRNINADILDKHFLNDVQTGKLAFRKGDTLKVLLNAKAWPPSKGLKPKYTILKVIERIHSNPQLNLLEDANHNKKNLFKDTE